MHSIWLVPAEPLNSRLRAIIRQLAAQYDAVDFAPHVTISAGTSDDDETCAIARDIASRFGPVELTYQKLDYSSLYTKTLFVQFHRSEIAQSMCDAINAAGARPSGYVLNPHLSLIYKTMPEATQAEISRVLEVPQGIYLFDGLRAIETEAPLTQPEQVKRWRVVFEAALGRR